MGTPITGRHVWGHVYEHDNYRDVYCHDVYTKATLVPTYLVYLSIYLPTCVPSSPWLPTYLIINLPRLLTFLCGPPTNLPTCLPKLLPTMAPNLPSQGPIYLCYLTFNLFKHMYGLCTHLGYLLTKITNLLQRLNQLPSYLLSLIKGSCTLRSTKNNTCEIHKSQGELFMTRYQTSQITIHRNHLYLSRSL
jgi:hypothetical protein